MSVTQISGRTHLEEVVASEDKNKLLVLYFYTGSSVRGKELSQAIRTAAVRYTRETTTFLFIDTAQNAELVSLFHVPAGDTDANNNNTTSPCLVVVRNGYILRTITGAELDDFVASLDECTETLLTVNRNNRTASQGKQIRRASDSSEESLATSEEAADPADALGPELEAGLAKLVHAVPVMIFIKGNPQQPRCRYSRQLVQLLRENGVRFGYFDVLQNDAVRTGMKAFSDWPTFPQLYVNGEFVGGLDILKETLKDEPDFFSNALT